MKKIILFLCFFCFQVNFGQRAFVHSYYDNCNFFKEITSKEITDCISIKKNEGGFEIIIKTPSKKDSKDFLNISLTTHNTELQKYPIGQDANDWLELEKGYLNTGSIVVNFHTQCAQKETYSGIDSTGFIELAGGSPTGKISGFFHANVNGVIITGVFKNIKIN
jgi:hypothetical protein